MSIWHQCDMKLTAKTTINLTSNERQSYRATLTKTEVICWIEFVIFRQWPPKQYSIKQKLNGARLQHIRQILTSIWHRIDVQVFADQSAHPLIKSLLHRRVTTKTWLSCAISSIRKLTENKFTGFIKTLKFIKSTLVPVTDQKGAPRANVPVQHSKKSTLQRWKQQSFASVYAVWNYGFSLSPSLRWLMYCTPPMPRNPYDIC